MGSTQHATRLRRTETLERLIREHEEEVARLREEFGDPQLALFAFTRDRFDRESLLASARQTGNWQAMDREDDDALDAR